MSGKKLNINGIANELEQSKFFAQARQNVTEERRTAVQVYESTAVHESSRTAVQATRPISERTVRKAFNIFKEQSAFIDWYVREKKISGRGNYNSSLFIRELIEDFIIKEKKRGKMEKYPHR